MTLLLILKNQLFEIILYQLIIVIITLQFSYQKNINIAQAQMIKDKNRSKSKAFSSYLLSGINIKKMIQEELNQEINSDISIIRVNRRPIFKIKDKDRGDKDKDTLANITTSLTNKSFKIRSFTKRLRDAANLSKGDDNRCQIFQKVQNFRNMRSNGNRIDLSHFSKQNKIEEEVITKKIQTKMKQILQRQTQIKCKITNQILIKQSTLKQNFNGSTIIQYQSFDSQHFRQLSHKIHVNFNQSFKHTVNKSILIIVSLQALHIHCKRVVKSFNGHYDDHNGNKTYEKSYQINQQQIELLKMLSERYYHKDGVLQKVKIAYKVNSLIELNQLKMVLQNNQIHDYFCIFYPIRKYAQHINLYQIDSLIHNTEKVVFIESKYKLKNEFPILSPRLKTVFFCSNLDNFLILSRTITAIKSFIYQQQLSKQIDQYNSKQDDQTNQNLNEDQLGNDSKRINNYIQPNKNQVKMPHLSQFCVKKEIINVQCDKISSKLQFTIKSRQLKQSDKLKRQSCIEKDEKRKILCQRQSNIPLTASIKYNYSVQFQQSNATEQKQNKFTHQNIEQLRQKLLSFLKNNRISEYSRQLSSERYGKRVEFQQKNDELEQITSFIKGSTCRSKTNHQIISQLIKKNTHINRQIGQYLNTTAFLNQRHDQSPCYFVSSFNEQLDENNEKMGVEVEREELHIVAYKIY